MLCEAWWVLSLSHGSHGGAQGYFLYCMGGMVLKVGSQDSRLMIWTPLTRAACYHGMIGTVGLTVISGIRGMVGLKVIC